MPRPAILITVALVALLSFLALAYWISTRISHHRRQREQAALDRAVVEERNAGWWIEDDSDEWVDHLLAVDPAPSRLYIPPARSMEPLGPIPPIGGVWS